MISSHVKKGFWLWIAACLLLWGLSKHAQFHQYAEPMRRIATVALWGGMAVLVIALLIVSYIEKLGAAKRMTELNRRVQSGETIEIRGGSGLPRLIVMSTFAGVILAAFKMGGPPFLFVVSVALLAPFAFLELLTVIPLLRHSVVLRISRETLESPVFGTLSWHDIEGIDLTDVELRGFSFHKRMNLLIPRLPGLTTQLHPATRLRHRIQSIFRPSTMLNVRLLRPSELPKVIVTLCRRTCSEYPMLSRRERALEEMQASLESAAMPSSRIPTEAEAKLNARVDATGFLASMRLLRANMRKQQDEMWEMQITPPPELMRTHWTTWVATVIAAVVMVGFVYLLYSASV